MKFLYSLLQNYGWTIVVFTIITRILMFPLSLKQQKSSAKQAAYQPMMQEIQKKYASNRQKQQEEVMKFQEENGIKMTAGCAPVILNMLVIFGIIAVIQAPLTYIVRTPKVDIDNGVAIVQHYDAESDISKNITTQQSLLIGEIKINSEKFKSGFTNANLDKDGLPLKDKEGNVLEPSLVTMEEKSVEEIENFQFNFIGLDLAKRPSIKSIDKYIILPIVSVLAMLLQQVFVFLTSGQSQGRGMMIGMTLFTGVMFGMYAFTAPVAFSLYYAISNVLMLVQQLVMKKIYDPEKIKSEFIAEMEERKKAKKAKKKIVIAAADGSIEEKEMNDADIVKFRLAKARELDAVKYADDYEDNSKANEEDG